MTHEDGWERELASLQTQLEKARENLRLISERKSEYVMQLDVPLDLIKQESKWEQRISGLEQEIAELSARLVTGGRLGPLSRPENPFGDIGRITDPGRFFDREELLRQIFEELSKGGVSLVGESQVGKSSLLSMICTLGPEQMGLPKRAFCYLSMQWVNSENGFYEALCDVLGIETCHGFKLVRALRSKRYVLCLDEIEKMTWDGFTRRIRDNLRGLADGFSAPLRLVIASRASLEHLFPDSPGQTSPLANICHQQTVEPFPPEVATAFLSYRLRGTGVTFTESEVAAILRETGGHPAKLQRAAANLYNLIKEQKLTKEMR